ncbi:MAG: alpha/beta hydrolase [Pseudorhodoplanes sp.]|uniref:alpha/beta hydrolase n=1 Tax=Pseudorhodoplanes sp. TaxID=1934341 RepID=UPI003D0FB3E2
MTTLKSILLIALAGYLGIVLLMYVAQRALMYFPYSERMMPADADFPQATELELKSRDGVRILAWTVAPKPGKPVVLYFHGNGGSLAHRVPRFRRLVEDGTGLVALSYRGYGGSDGSPSEDGLIADARAAYDEARTRYPDAKIVLWGESLGTGVAVALAAENDVAAVILEAPFTSAADVAFSAYPFVPVRLLMKDQFRSDERIGKVKAPVLVMHGARDRVVPFRLGERLFALANEPKQFVRFADGGHEDLDRYDHLAAARDFLAQYVR